MVFKCRTDGGKPVAKILTELSKLSCDERRRRMTTMIAIVKPVRTVA
jgi:hypothetical protein